LTNENIGSGTGLVGAFLISFGYPAAFLFFLASNVFFIRMGREKQMRSFLVMQMAFTLTSLIGIWNNYGELI